MTYIPAIVSGSYAGSGSGQTITIGWRPAAVVICSDRDTGPATGRGISIKFDQLSGSNTLYWDTASGLAAGITLTSTGFTVNTDDRVDRSGSNFYWIAIRPGASVEQGSYTGDGNDTQTITLTKKPSFLLIYDTVSGYTYVKTQAHPTDECMRYDTGTAYIANNGIAFVSSGFTVDDSAGRPAESDTNISSRAYEYLALHDVSTNMRYCVSGTYVGQDPPTTLEIDLGGTPKWVIIYNDFGSLTFWYKTSDMVSDSHESVTLTATHVSASNVLLFTANGFSVSSLTNGNGVDYFYTAGIQ